ncbi:hypothetical protein L3X38_019237 [Prunus dulcis]|uniref:Uncharacterized protein n=1 Tax=Prunus dulcis TaxID=3755 RepID=A0AAD4WAN9_PRUDU|nr:hypothetical protein L3X38_019237 [Prunus dulcis]
MLKLAKLLYHRGFHITSVSTEFIYKHCLQSPGPNSLDGLPNFRFETTPDGLAISSDEDTAKDITLLFHSIRKILPPQKSSKKLQLPLTLIPSDLHALFQMITCHSQTNTPPPLFPPLKNLAFLSYSSLLLQQATLWALRVSESLTAGKS